MAPPKTAEIEARYARPLPEILAVLYEKHGTVKKVADELGVTYKTCYDMYQRHGVSHRRLVMPVEAGEVELLQKALRLARHRLKARENGDDPYRKQLKRADPPGTIPCRLMVTPEQKRWLLEQCAAALDETGAIGTMGEVMRRLIDAEMAKTGDNRR